MPRTVRQNSSPTIFASPTRSASARADGRSVTLEIYRMSTLALGDIVVRDVTVAVGNSDGPALLGMSFLSSVKWTHTNGRLVLEQ